MQGPVAWIELRLLRVHFPGGLLRTLRSGLQLHVQLEGLHMGLPEPKQPDAGSKGEALAPPPFPGARTPSSSKKPSKSKQKAKASKGGKVPKVPTQLLR
jgi:hypothetical protein